MSNPSRDKKVKDLHFCLFVICLLGCGFVPTYILLDSLCFFSEIFPLKVLGAVLGDS